MCIFLNSGTGAGVVYRARLESVCWVKPTEGSNPSLSEVPTRTGHLTSWRGLLASAVGGAGMAALYLFFPDELD